jgi:hypothetical protein
MLGGHGRHSDIGGRYGVLLAFLTVVTLPIKVIKLFRFRMRGRLSLGDALLERLAQPLEHVATARRQFIQKEDAVVRPRHLAWPRHVAPTDQPHIGEGLMWSATRAGRDQRRAGTGDTGDAADARGLDGLGEGHRRQDGGESACQCRLACSWGTKEEHIMVRTPASSFRWHRHDRVDLTVIYRSLRRSSRCVRVRCFGRQIMAAYCKPI